jgi:hypothetical protein
MDPGNAPAGEPFRSFARRAAGSAYPADHGAAACLLTHSALPPVQAAFIAPV